MVVPWARKGLDQPGRDRANHAELILVSEQKLSPTGRKKDVGICGLERTTSEKPPPGRFLNLFISTAVSVNEGGLVVKAPHLSIRVLILIGLCLSVS